MINFYFFSAVYSEDRPMNQPLGILFRVSLTNIDGSNAKV